MSLYRREGSPFWWCKFKSGGREYRFSTEQTNKREAGRVETTKREEIAAAGRLTRSMNSGESITLSEAVARYIAEVGHELVDIKSVGIYLKKCIEFLGGDRQIITIDDTAIAQLVRWRSAQHANGDPRRPKLSPASVNRSTVQALQPVFTLAADVWKIRLTNEPNWKAHKLEEPKERVRVMKPSEDRALESVFNSDYEALRAFTLESALRKRASLIKWSNIDFEEGVIEAKTKRGKIARVPLTPSILAILKSRNGHHPEYVFTYIAERTLPKRQLVKGKRYPITYSGWSTYWRRRRVEAGVKDFRQHDMRHDRATRIYEATGDLALVQKLLGHANIQTTQKYAHVSLDHVRAGMLKADAKKQEVA